MKRHPEKSNIKVIKCWITLKNEELDPFLFSFIVARNNNASWKLNLRVLSIPKFKTRKISKAPIKNKIRIIRHEEKIMGLFANFGGKNKSQNTKTIDTISNTFLKFSNHILNGFTSYFST